MKLIEVNKLGKAAVVSRLKRMSYVLDEYLGDTDPMFDEDMTDEEIQQEEPIFWISKELNLLIQDLGG